jgi:hypothetical protein
MLEELKEKIAQRKYWSSVLKNSKDFLAELFTDLKTSVLRVEITNPDTKLLKEVAENTRKAASRIGNLVEGEGLTVKSDVSVVNTVKTEVVNWPPQQAFPKTMDVRIIKDPETPEEEAPEAPESVRIVNFDEFPVPKTRTAHVDLSPLQIGLENIDNALRSLSTSVARQKAPEIVMPKAKEFPKSISLNESEAILDALEDVTKGINGLRDVIEEGNSSEMPRSVTVENFPPQHIPTPVTNININPLRGVIYTTAVTVSASATPLPATSLENRRSVSVYNNSSQTLYVGGANVTTSNGVPVPASSYSNIFDAGEHMILYGVVASSTADIRVLEVSNEATGG